MQVELNAAYRLLSFQANHQEEPDDTTEFEPFADENTVGETQYVAQPNTMQCNGSKTEDK
jgi:hypothetical protein